MKGSYFLVIRLDEGKRIRTKGKTFELKPGYYVYVGSAMNSLEKRVARHFRREKRLHWHIDYFLKEAELLRAYLIPSKVKLEEELSREVSKFGEPIPGFGAGDVKVSSNLYRFEDEPDEALMGILDKLGLGWKIVKSEDETYQMGE
ncbi:GIY-YIG nuclease family protein [Thermococcus prieurii]